MTFENKSQKAFVALTLVTVLSIVSVLTVYAVLLGTFYGPGEVTIGGMGSGTVMYTSDNSTWDTSLTRDPSAAWFTRLVIDSGGYSGPATLTWQLEKKMATWENVTGASTTTSIVLSSSGQTVYATSDGASGDSNYNWGSNTTTAGTYRVKVWVNSA